jgi:hypothetical protein
MSHICDKCGADFFVSAHDLVHHTYLTICELNTLLVLLPASERYEEARKHLLSFKEYLEDFKLVKLNIKEN